MKKIVIKLERLGRMEMAFSLARNVLVAEERRRVQGKVPGAQMSSYLNQFELAIVGSADALNRVMRRSNPEVMMKQVRDHVLGQITDDSGVIAENPNRRYFCDDYPYGKFELQDEFVTND